MPATVLQAIRGMNDILPGESAHWHALESTVRAVLAAYDYQEIRFPVVERTELFSRSIGEVTDIIEKEMYTFTDRNGESLSLRPEGTAGCVRACIEHGLLHHKTQRVWYTGPMFRYEKPQKGRYRQFHQIGAEAYGFLGPDIDAEMIALTARLWDRLGIRPLVRLELNSLGTTAARAAYREQLVTYFQTHHAALDADSERRLHTNPLRILDSKNPHMQDVIAGAPQLNDHLDVESRAHFEGLRALLDAVGITYVVNPRLVRGLDYYSKTVFEWVTDHLGAQGTVCAGGRYDGLVAQLGGPQVAGIGFAMGVERLIALLEGLGALHTKPVDVYCILVGEAAQRHGFVFAETLRTALPTLGVRLNCGGGNFKSQFKRADQSGARFAVVLGEDEVQKGFITIKPLREAEGHQVSLPEIQAIDHLRAALLEKG